MAIDRAAEIAERILWKQVQGAMCEHAQYRGCVACGSAEIRAAMEEARRDEREACAQVAHDCGEPLRQWMLKLPIGEERRDKSLRSYECFRVEAAIRARARGEGKPDAE